MALRGKCRSGFGERVSQKPLLRQNGRVSLTALLPLEVAELHVFLSPFLLGEEGAEGIEFGFGWIALASNVHLVVTTIDEVWSDGCG